MRVIICANTAWNLLNFRAGLIRSFLERGIEVIAVAPPHQQHAAQLMRMGCRFEEMPMDNMGTSPIGDLALLMRFRRLFSRTRPDVYLGYTIKPNIYGSIAAKMLGVSVINNIAGLGVAFSKGSRIQGLVEILYRYALRGSRRVFFQNREDRDDFVRKSIVMPGSSDLLPGSGVDLLHFMPARALPSEDGPKSVFLLVARVLWEKGVGEFAEAARIVRSTNVQARFQLLGFLDVQNPSAVSKTVIEQWVKEGVIEYLGVTDDVRRYLAAADCVVLPSYYREGTPRSLLEAAAMGRPIITTDWTGCRNVVDDGVNGYLCQPRDARHLADRMLKFMSLSLHERVAMGDASRAKAEHEFDERLVIQKYLNAIGEV
ncbi:glycosyltransferase family 4 protein [Mesorhizobium sp. M1380]|uniref:glycosyltransferase family 4 protein n=1 Tax=Mesorhizobium sp. M1380 TaxID=2957093 RepID=UPI003337433C